MISIVFAGSNAFIFHLLGGGGLFAIPALIYFAFSFKRFIVSRLGLLGQNPRDAMIISMTYLAYSVMFTDAVVFSYTSKPLWLAMPVVLVPLALVAFSFWFIKVGGSEVVSAEEYRESLKKFG